MERLMIKDVFSFQMLNSEELIDLEIKSPVGNILKRKSDLQNSSKKIPILKTKSISGEGTSFNIGNNSLKEVDLLVKKKKKKIFFFLLTKFFFFFI